MQSISGKENSMTRIPAVNNLEDCGCGPTVFEGKPSDTARNNINHRAAISKVPVFKMDGTQTCLDEIIGEANSDKIDRTSLVVFLRSLG